VVTALLRLFNSVKGWRFPVGKGKMKEKSKENKQKREEKER